MHWKLHRHAKNEQIGAISSGDITTDKTLINGPWAPVGALNMWSVHKMGYAAADGATSDIK